MALQLKFWSPIERAYSYKRGACTVRHESSRLYGIQRQLATIPADRGRTAAALLWIKLKIINCGQVSVCPNTTRKVHVEAVWHWSGKSSPSLPSFLSSLSTPSLPLEVGGAPLNTVRGSGGALQTSPAGSGAKPQRKSNFVYFSLKIWHLMASNLLIFLRINRPRCMYFFLLVFLFISRLQKLLWCKHKNSSLSNDWSGSRLVCQTCSYARALPVGEGFGHPTKRGFLGPTESTP